MARDFQCQAPGFFDLGHLAINECKFGPICCRTIRPKKGDKPENCRMIPFVTRRVTRDVTVPDVTAGPILNGGLNDERL